MCGSKGQFGVLEHEFCDFPYIGNFIIATDELIFFRGGRLNHQPVMLFGGFRIGFRNTLRVMRIID